jgi:hypothetical protein
MNMPGAYTVHPDPARDVVNLLYEHAGEGVEGMVMIRQLNGQIIATLPMNGPQGQLNWNTTGTAPGIYFVEFVQGEMTVKTVKLIVQR